MKTEIGFEHYKPVRKPSSLSATYNQPKLLFDKAVAYVPDGGIKGKHQLKNRMLLRTGLSGPLFPPLWTEVKRKREREKEK